MVGALLLRVTLRADSFGASAGSTDDGSETWQDFRQPATASCELKSAISLGDNTSARRFDIANCEAAVACSCIRDRNFPRLDMAPFHDAYSLRRSLVV